MPTPSPLNIASIHQSYDCCTNEKANFIFKKCKYFLLRCFEHCRFFFLYASLLSVAHQTNTDWWLWFIYLTFFRSSIFYHAQNISWYNDNSSTLFDIFSWARSREKIHYRERLEEYKGNAIVTICVKNNSDAY
jgi:hypothetical protein